MANPQKENGYTSIANEILHALMACKLLNYEVRVVICVIRKTYGWNKKTDWVSNSQISKETGLARSNVTRTVKSLLVKKILLKEGKKIGLQKDWERWNVDWFVDKKVISRGNSEITHHESEKLKIVISPDNRVISPDNKKLSHQIPTKEKKETIQKTLVETCSTKSKNQNNMSWNIQNDNEADETAIDYETGEITDQKPVRKKKYPNAPAVRKIFLEVLGRNPANWGVNKTQLQACENLVEERGLEKIKTALIYFKNHEEEEYCPSITSPYDLDSKWTKLGNYKIKNGN